MDSASPNPVDTVRCRHFSASLARAASAWCTRFSASTPRINLSGASSLFASCTITSAIFRGSPSERPSRLRSSLSIEPTEAAYSGSRSGAFCPARRAQLVRIPPGSSVQTWTPNGGTRGVNHAVETRVHDGLEVFRTYLLEWRNQPVAGIIDQHIQTPEGVHR